MTLPSSFQPAIAVEGITKRFGSVVALDGVTVSVAPGELFFLLGPSGCGKTTLLRILAGLEQPDAGRIYFAGRDVTGLPPHERGAPMVFQNYALWPHLRVRENVAFGLMEQRRAKSEMRQRVEAALRLVSLEEMADRLPGQLSGGQQQRVALARALILNPDVLLLDEPLSNLDAKLRGEMREELHRLHRETGITFVYVTHDQAEALSLADRLAVLRDGRLVGLGTPQELYRRPPNRFCAAFLGEANFVEGKVLAVAGGQGLIETPFGRWYACVADSGRLSEEQIACCLVRPESIQLGLYSGEANTFRAEIVSVRFHGVTVTIRLRASGCILQATLLSREGYRLKPGVTADFGIRVEDTVVVPEE